MGKVRPSANDYIERDTICQGVASAKEIKNLGITTEGEKEEAV